jgi:hypothetical protein
LRNLGQILQISAFHGKLGMLKKNCKNSERVIYIYNPAIIHTHTRLLKHKPNGPEIGLAFSSFFMIRVFFQTYKMLRFPQHLKHHLCFWARNSIANCKEINRVLPQRRVYFCCYAPPKYVTDFGVICVSPQRQRFFSITSTCGPSLQ